MKERMQLGTAVADAGQKARGYVEAFRRQDGRTVDLPVLIINGSRPGPTVWLSSCHHGDDIGGAVVIFRVFEEIRPEDLAGSIIAVPVSNPTAVQAKQRNSPIDNKDLERAFPGDPNGSYTDRLAYAIHQLVLDRADCLIDLHGVLKELKIIHQAFFDYFTPSVKAANRALAEAMDCEYVVGLPEKEYWGGAGQQCLVVGEHGIPSVLSETTFDLQSQYKDVINVLIHLKMLSGQLAPKKKIYQKTLHLLLAKHSGIFVPTVELYDRVKKGDLLARILNFAGEVVEEIRCPIDDGIVALTRNLPVVEAVWENVIVGSTFELAGVFEIGEVGNW
jgi:predicted deacylase